MPSQQFVFDDQNGIAQTVEWGSAGLTVVLDEVALMQQLVPASAIGLFNATVIAGHDTSFQVAAKQAGGAAFPLGPVGNVVPINFYAKIHQSDTVLVFNKSHTGNPLDVLVPDPTGADGLINVFVRAADYANVAVSTTMFLYIDVLDSVGNPVNISKWTLTITN